MPLCENCSLKPPVVRRPKTGARVCKQCFSLLFEEEVHQTIVTNGLFDQEGLRVAIGASGGKDSTVLARVLSVLKARYNYPVELILLSIDEGIRGYRDDSLEAVKRNREEYQMQLKIVSFKELYGWTMDEIVAEIGQKSNCTACLEENTPVMVGCGRARKIRAVRQVGEGREGADLREGGGTGSCKQERPAEIVYSGAFEQEGQRVVRASFQADQLKENIPQGRKEVFQLTLLDGKQLLATGDHRLLTRSGWKHVYELNFGFGGEMQNRVPSPALSPSLSRRLPLPERELFFGEKRLQKGSPLQEADRIFVGPHCVEECEEEQEECVFGPFSSECHVHQAESFCGPLPRAEGQSLLRFGDKSQGEAALAFARVCGCFLGQHLPSFSASSPMDPLIGPRSCEFEALSDAQEYQRDLSLFISQHNSSSLQQLFEKTKLEKTFNGFSVAIPPDVANLFSSLCGRNFSSLELLKEFPIAFRREFLAAFLGSAASFRYEEGRSAPAALMFPCFPSLASLMERHCPVSLSAPSSTPQCPTGEISQLAPFARFFSFRFSSRKQMVLSACLSGLSFLEGLRKSREETSFLVLQQLLRELPAGEVSSSSFLSLLDKLAVKELPNSPKLPLLHSSFSQLSREEFLSFAASFHGQNPQFFGPSLAGSADSDLLRQAVSQHLKSLQLDDPPVSLEDFLAEYGLQEAVGPSCLSASQCYALPVVSVVPYLGRQKDQQQSLSEAVSPPLFEVFDLSMGSSASSFFAGSFLAHNCGLFRRSALDKGALLLDVDLIVTGHNADDMAETVLMNVLRGDLLRLDRCVEIVTGGKERRAEGQQEETEVEEGLSLIPRCKPFKYCYEKEIVMYAYYNRLDYFSTECIYAPYAYRGFAREFLKQLEKADPKSIIRIIESAESMKMEQERREGRRQQKTKCSRCGLISSNEVCKACAFLEGLNQGRGREVLGGGALTDKRDRRKREEKKRVHIGLEERIGGFKLGEKETRAEAAAAASSPSPSSASPSPSSASPSPLPSNDRVATPLAIHQTRNATDW